MQDLLVPLAMSLVAGLATSIGGAIALAPRRPGGRFMAASLGLSAGVMIYVSFVELLATSRATLTQELGAAGGWWTLFGFLGGIALIAVIDRLVPSEINPHEPGTTDADARRARMLRTGLLTAGVLAIHNFPEGFAVFLAATQQPGVAWPVVGAIAIHNIPEGIAVAVPVAYATGSRAKGFWYATTSGLAEPLGALLGFLLLRAFLGPVALGTAFAAVAGIMVFVSLDELLPTAQDFGHHHAAIYGLVAGMAVMGASLLLL